MTGYTVHTGATEKFVEGWDHIFKKKTGSKGAAKAKTPAAKKKKSAAKAPRAKSRNKKSGKKRARR
jgi:hypothetical protein